MKTVNSSNYDFFAYDLSFVIDSFKSSFTVI